MWGPGGGKDEPPGADHPPAVDQHPELDQALVEMQPQSEMDQLLGAAEREASDVKDKCEENKSQLETLKEIMLRNKQSLKQKEEEVQEYAKKLSKIKSRAKLSRRSRDAASSVEGTPESIRKSTTSSPTSFPEVVDDVMQARTPKAKSSLLQQKLAENKKIFERRSREMTENKRAVEEKVEAIRQKLEESDSREIPNVLPVQPVSIKTQVAGLSLQQDKDNKIAELSNKVVQLEGIILDLKENLKEKDSVIRSKTKAVALVSRDLSKRSKSTLDTLEDTKDEMRTMQSNFVLIETSLKQKVDSLLTQLQQRDEKISEYEETMKNLTSDIEKQKVTSTATADFSRSALDTLAETKDAMKSMQENFILIESSLKSKNDNLLAQLEEREMKLAEADERIFRLESGAGVSTPPDVDQLHREIHALKQVNRQLQDEKYELQKSVSEYQAKLVSNEPIPSNGLIVEKDNRIAELENLVEELRKSNQLLLEESKSELQLQIAELTSKNEEYSNKVNDLEVLVHNLESEKNELLKKIPEDTDETKEDAKVTKLAKELDDLNKSMIKLKAQHKSKVKNLQKQLESFKKVSDANAELVKLGNQVALLEEEKGNLQLSLVDFDELKVSSGDWQERISDLESKLSAQSSELEAQVQAIATLENQKLDLIQELHAMKQEVSALEMENAESENLRVTAEMKVIELEEQLDSIQKTNVSKTQSSSANVTEIEEYEKKIESLSRENGELIVKLSKLEEKGTSDAGSTESFETIHETDRADLLKKIELLSQENSELVVRLTKLEERTGSTESFDSLNETSRNEFLKKIDLLARENDELSMKLAKVEEKGSSDSGSTESFERIPSEHTESRLDILTQENNELVIKLIKLEERLAQNESGRSEDELSEMQRRIDNLVRENNELVIRSTKLEEKMEQLSGFDSVDGEIRTRLQSLVEENNELVIKMTKLEERGESMKIDLDLVSKERDDLRENLEELRSKNPNVPEDIEKIDQDGEGGVDKEVESGSDGFVEKGDNEEGEKQSRLGNVTAASLENEIEGCRKLISEQTEAMEEMKSKLAEKQVELDAKAEKIAEYEASGKNLDDVRAELDESLSVIREWKLKCEQIEEKIKALEVEKASIEEGLRILEVENARLVDESEKKDERVRNLERSNAEKEEEIVALKESIASKEVELRDKYEKLRNEMIAIDGLQEEVEKYKNQFQEQKMTIERLKEEMAESDRTAMEKSEEVVALSAEIETLRSRVEEYDRLREEVVKIREHERQLAGESNELRVKKQGLESNLEQMREIVTRKERELVEASDANRQLEIAETQMTARISHLENALRQNNTYMEKLREELAEGYKKMELVKAKHDEDIGMQNRRLEDLLDELHAKSSQNENLKKELASKEGMLDEFAKNDAQNALKARIGELETQLAESQEKAGAQLEKMKVIAANLKKKAAKCLELEARANQLEEQWNSEKAEKDAINGRILEKQRAIEEKDKRILELEESLGASEGQLSRALQKVRELEAEISSSGEKIDSLVAQVTEMEVEVDKLRADVEEKASKLSGERSAREDILARFEVYKIEAVQEAERRQEALDEAKESTRELGVRMQVMEKEYVDQLALIQDLRAEKGLLSSKEAQISERLEIAEKESEERRVLLETMESQRSVEARKGRTLDRELREEEEETETGREEGRISVEALEAKLQEREAVIESLETELARANETVNRLQETIEAAEERRRSLVRRTELLGEELEQSARMTEEVSASEDVLEQRLAALVVKDEAVGRKLAETIEENAELIEKIKTLQDLNASLQERIEAAEEELGYGRETNEKLRNADLMYSELLEKSTKQEAELKKAQQDLHSAKLHIDNSEREVTAQINQLDSERRHLMEKCEKLEDLKINLMQEIESLKDGVSLCRQRITELEEEANAGKVLGMEPKATDEPSEDLEKVVEKLKIALVEKEAEIENYQRRNMQLQMAAFTPKAGDASDVFGTPSLDPGMNSSTSEEIRKLNDLLERKENEKVDIGNELELSRQQVVELRSELERISSQSADLRLRFGEVEENSRITGTEYGNEIIKLNEALAAGNERIVALESHEEVLKAEIERLSVLLTEKDADIETITEELRGARDALSAQESSRYEIETKNATIDQLEEQKREAQEIVNHIVAIAEQKVNKFHETRDQSSGLRRIAATFDDVLEDLEEVRKQLHDVSSEKESLQQRVEELTSALNESRMQQVVVTPSPMEEPIKKSEQTEVESAWEDESEVKLELEEEGWGWSAEEARLEEQHQLSSAPTVTSSLEVELRTRIAELDEEMADLKVQRGKLEEEVKTLQLKNGKLMKKLKEFKVQNEQLQRKAKQQSSGFDDLDSAIEEELKSQIEALEKKLKEAKEEQRTNAAEKDHLLKRLEVLTAANERFVEMKERQDMEAEVWQIRNKELTQKLEAMEWRVQEVAGSVDQDGFEAPPSRREPRDVKSGVQPRDSEEKSPGESEEIGKRYQAEIDDLKAEMEALASENEQLQQLLEERKRHEVETRDVDRSREAEVNVKKMQEELDSLRKQYEQSLMDANDQVTAMRRNNDLVRAELDEKALEFDQERESLMRDIEERGEKLSRLEETLRNLVKENADLVDKLSVENSSAEKISSISVSLAEVTELLNARVQEVADLKREAQQNYVERTEAENALRERIRELTEETSRERAEIDRLNQAKLEADERNSEAGHLQVELEALRKAIAEKDSVMEAIRVDSENVRKILGEQESSMESRTCREVEEKEMLKTELASYVSKLEASQMELNALKSVATDRNEMESWVKDLQSRLADKEKEIGTLTQDLAEKGSAVEWYANEVRRITASMDSLSDEAERLRELLRQKDAELIALGETIAVARRRDEETARGPPVESVALPDTLPRFTMGGGDDLKLDSSVEISALKNQLLEKEQEIEHFKYILNENTYPALISQLQGDIERLYNERHRMEESSQQTIRELNEALASKQVEIDQMNDTRAKQRSSQEQETIAGLQNELHAKEQQINELRYVMAQKESEMAIQASYEPRSDDFEAQETLERLNGELYASQQEVESLRSTLIEKEKDAERLDELLGKLTSEKELVREEAEKLLQSRLREKEMEIDALKQRLAAENQQLLDAMGVKEKDVANLRIQMENIVAEHEDEVRRRDGEFMAIKTELGERERRLAEVSVTKDVEIHALKMQIQKKDERIAELVALSDEEEKQLVELRRIVDSKEEEMDNLKSLLAETVQEYENIQKALRRDVKVAPATEGVVENTDEEGSSSTAPEGVVTIEGERDLALYMLHQRDVRCEELTLELMQLLEERDTLQLRLSNAIRVNEELRQQITPGQNPSKEAPSTSAEGEPIIEQPSPSKSDGPVEIAKDALDVHMSAIGEDIRTLAAKLSQLHSVDQRRDVRLCDDRESRHTQQMSFVSRREMLSSLPPEAAAKLVNANYTLSRDVQSQSSVLMNWLWGKSTPKVMHM